MAVSNLGSFEFELASFLCSAYDRSICLFNVRIQRCLASPPIDFEIQGPCVSLWRDWCRTSPCHVFLVYEIYKKVFSSGNLNNLTIVAGLAVSPTVTSDVCLPV